MTFPDLVQLYGHLPQAGALAKTLEDNSVRRVFLQGLVASSQPLLFASVAKKIRRTILFILDDADEAAYFFNDISRMGSSADYFFPSAYRRAVKYGQRDAANEISRTEVLAALAQRKDKASKGEADEPLCIVTYPSAIAELVVSERHLDERRISLKTSQTIDITDLEHRLRDLSFKEVDYVYEPGQFAARGSILDVYSYSSELPFRIDFFGDEIDSIRTFTVEDQLSKDRKTGVEPDMGVVSERGVVGIVSTVSDHFSVVIPLLNPKFKLSCKVLGSSYFGTLSWNGRNARFANLDELPRHVEFEKGDTIVTSGYSAIFPSGIIVGKVVNFEKQHDDNFYSLEVELATDFQALNNVRIIKNYRQAEQKNTEREAKKND